MDAGGDVRVEELTRDNCMQLIQYHSYLGRIGFVVDGRPVILPVNYLAEEHSIVFCTAEGGKLAALTGGAPVAFEVDDHRPLGRGGWSVLVHGTAAEVTEPDDVERLRRGPLRSWAVPEAQHYVRIRIEEVSGRRVPEGLD